MKRPSVHYTISMDDPQKHLFRIKLQIAGFDKKYQDLFMPVWTPGSYYIRDYSKNVVQTKAFNGDEQLKMYKLTKNKWRIEIDNARRVTVEYDVYAFDSTVRTCFLDVDRAMIIGAGIYLFPVPRKNYEIRVTINPPGRWKKITTELEPIPNKLNSFLAENFDILVDSPIAVGNHKIHQFEVSGIKHQFAISGQGNYDINQIISDTKKILTSTHKIFNEAPYSHYTFFIQTSAGGFGGLEHLNSCFIMYDRWRFKARNDYLKFILLIAHEFFHCYNVKRIRPIELGPFNYEAENYSTMHWVTEGFTNYFDKLLLLRAGVITTKEYFKLINQDITRFYRSPGRNIQSVAEASFDAWIKFYQKNENTINSTISYYLKGSLIGLALDLALRSATDGEKSIDDIYRALWLIFKETDSGFTEQEFMEISEQVAGISLNKIWQYVHTTIDFNFDQILEPFGLDLTVTKNTNRQAWLGFELNHDNLEITKVVLGGPAYEYGLNVNDELISVNGIRLTSKNYVARLTELEPGVSAQIQYVRDGLMRAISVIPISKMADNFILKQIKNPTDHQKYLYENWLGTHWNSNSDPSG